MVFKKKKKKKFVSKNTESRVASVLKKYCRQTYPDTILEYKVFKNPKTGQYLPFDIFIPQFKLFIEVQGEQHYKYTPYFHKTKKDFEYRIWCDKIKKDYAEKNGYYLEIDNRLYWENPRKAIKTVKRRIRRIKILGI